MGSRALPALYDDYTFEFANTDSLTPPLFLSVRHTVSTYHPLATTDTDRRTPRPPPMPPLFDSGDAFYPAKVKEPDVLPWASAPLHRRRDSSVWECYTAISSAILQPPLATVSQKLIHSKENSRYRGDIRVVTCRRETSAHLRLPTTHAPHARTLDLPASSMKIAKLSNIIPNFRVLFPDLPPLSSPAPHLTAPLCPHQLVPFVLRRVHRPGVEL
jgi:hypothetical protein